MNIPNLARIALPLLELLDDGKERSIRDCIDALADHFQLSQEARTKLLPSGRQSVFENRVAWTRTYLKKAGLLKTSQRGVLCITPRGKEILKNPPERIDIPFLMRFEEFVEFRTQSRRQSDDAQSSSITDSEPYDPVEQIEQAFEHYQESLIDEVLEKVRCVSPAFFEHLVIRLLVKMGYGGGLKQAAEVVGGSGDEGIDGIINEDKLGLDVIYIQAKLWTNPVGRPEIQKFVGALHGKRAKKGVFITSSEFTREAREYVGHLEPRVVLIDGRTMARLMIEHNVGVTTKSTYELKSIDQDFFDEGI